MSATAVRRVVVAVCVIGVVGMIVSSIADRTGAAMTFGLSTAVAVLCLMVATAVTGGAAGRAGAGDDAAGRPRSARETEDDEAAAERLESAVRQLVARGADEIAVRDLVRDAIAFGRRR